MSNGPKCPRCGTDNDIVKLRDNKISKKEDWYCRTCRVPFTWGRGIKG